jgi:hypothetical protein
MPPETSLFNSASYYLSKDQVDFLNDTQTVLERLEKDHISDYSFLVAPVAKAYEGYLKDFFLKIKIMSHKQYNSDHFRVGKTLNPSLRYKKFSIYQKLTNISENGEKLAEILWTAWKYGRNQIFHYFPGKLQKLTRAEAEERINTVLKAIITSGRFLDENPQGSSF